MRTLLIATQNEGKLREMQSLLKDVPIHLVGLADLPPGTLLDVDETAATLEGNALIKAYTCAVRSGHLTLAEDSGLEVDALAGAPGVRSARWVEGTDADRYQALLNNLETTPDNERTARFRTVIALVDPVTLQALTAEGRAEGVITREPNGTHGFGYDPIFRYSATGKTGGEMTKEEKNKVSHRGKALAELPRLLREIYETGRDKS